MLGIIIIFFIVKSVCLSSCTQYYRSTTPYFGLRTEDRSRGNSGEMLHENRNFGEDARFVPREQRGEAGGKDRDGETLSDGTPSIRSNAHHLTFCIGNSVKTMETVVS